MKIILINLNRYFHMILLWESPIKLPVELPVELPALGRRASCLGHPAWARAEQIRKYEMILKENTSE